MQLKQISILDSYQDRRVLLTGATGFVGKVLFAMMLDRLPNIKCFYVLIRTTHNQSPLKKFTKNILSSPAFKALCEKNRVKFFQLLTKKVKVIEGDITSPNLGLSPLLLKYLTEKLDLVINVAGLVDFAPPVDESIKVNIQGVINVAEFVKKCAHASLQHISTCYVAGDRDGVFAESVELEKSPNGKSFDPVKEYNFLKQAIDEITVNHKSKKMQRMQLIALGCERASFWGWINTYCYAKAIAEKILVTQYSDINFLIVRPSIVESAVNFPFPGWNEGFNTTAPLSYVACHMYPFLVAKKNCVIDVIPVDYVCNAMIIAGAVLIKGTGPLVIQLASSCVNPLVMKYYSKYFRDWNRANVNDITQGFTYKRLIAFLPLFIISPRNFFAPENLFAVVKKIHVLLVKFNKKIRLFSGAIKRLDKVLYQMRRVLKVSLLFRPFVYSRSCLFISDEITYCLPEESLFNHNMKELNWKNYIVMCLLPGLNQWIFPVYEKKLIKMDDVVMVLTSQEETALLSLLGIQEIC